jgi:hypothetical protein
MTGNDVSQYHRKHRTSTYRSEPRRMVALPTGISFIRLDELENGDVKLFSVISFFSRLVDLLLFELLSLLEFLSLGLMKKLDIIFLLEVAVLFDFLLLWNGVLEKVNILVLFF